MGFGSVTVMAEVELSDVLDDTDVTDVVEHYGDDDVLDCFSAEYVVEHFDNDELIEAIGKEKILEYFGWEDPEPPNDGGGEPAPTPEHTPEPEAPKSEPEAA